MSETKDQIQYEGLMHKAQQLLSKGKWLHAVQVYLSIIQKAPEYIPAYYELASLYYQRKNFAEVEKILFAALEIDKDHTSCLFLMGNVYFSLGKNREALEYYHRLVKNQVRFPELSYNLALSYLREGEKEKAETYLRATLREDPGFHRGNELLGEVLVHRKSFNEAIRYLQRAVETEPYHWTGWYLLGTAYISVKNWEQACAVFEKAFQLRPDDSEILRMYGWSLVNHEKFREGERLLKRSIELNPENIEAMTDLGIAYVQNKRVQEGIKWLKKAIELEPNNVLALEHIKKAKLILQNNDN